MEAFPAFSYNRPYRQNLQNPLVEVISTVPFNRYILFNLHNTQTRISAQSKYVDGEMLF